MDQISRNETNISGRWDSSSDRTVEDETCKRIRSLISDHLIERRRSTSGWDILYQDPNDGRFWELTFPHSEMHGGGPPELNAISAGDADAKYD
ncbi:hypothetical protein HFP51_01840 [Parasphingopyxis sp. CP4]|uniref:Imm27 family immunity protein n=1 Tax=Parasphingopyxis sp. CP4 TaxID=2724527 RepID=UPI0015A46B97|nr:hypothetical protein HFP51_01840 [Parasphingopyxis sp. CP4]